MDDDLAGRSALELAALVRSGDVSAVEVTRAHLERIEREDPAIHSLVRVDAEAALAAAGTVERGQPLAGVPFVVKDNVAVEGQVTAAGSRAHAGVAEERDAPVVARLRAAGAVLVGRANMDELAMGASTQTSAYGPTRNPVDHRRSPGGSSGGCAAAVAAGLVPLAVGTDTGGSVREPASQCGVVGMAPSRDLVPMTGVLPFMPGLDRVGPLARDVADARALLETMAGRLPPAGPVTRVGVVAELAGDRNRPEVLVSFIAWTEQVEVPVVTLSLPDAPHALAAYMVLTSVAALDWLDPWLASGRAGEEVVRRHAYAVQLVEHDVERVRWAEDVRRRLRAQVAQALAEVDVLLSPTMPTTAPLLFGPVSPEELADPLAAPYTDCWTVVANLAGVPALSVPGPAADGQPVGTMLMGRPGSDASLLDLAAVTTLEP